jgi:hypothetical protein
MKLREIKRGLVAQMARKSGEFWEHLQKARKRWGITPVARIPPEVPDMHYPPNEPEERILRPRFLHSWCKDVRSLRDLAVPEAYHHSRLPGDWTKFLSACLLYDPPNDDLEGFACYADPDPSTLDIEENRDVLVLPIKYLRDPDRVQADAEWRIKNRIDRMGELLQQKLEQAGITPEQFSVDIRELWREAGTFNPSCPEDKYRNFIDREIENIDREIENLPRPYIDLSHEETTEDDIRAAYAEHKKREQRETKEGRRNSDELEAIQCAFFVDRLGWSVAEVADNYGFSVDTAKKRIKDGR